MAAQDIAEIELLEAVCHAATDVKGDVSHVVTDLVDRLAPLQSVDARRRAIDAAVARLTGLDALEPQLADPDVDEVMVNAGGEIWVDRRGTVSCVGTLPPSAIDVVLERALSPVGKRLDRTNPIVDVRLPDGSRLCAVISPIAVDGTTVAIRRHRPRPFSIDDFGVSDEVAAVVSEIVTGRCNVLISGATSAGKTALLGALLNLIGRHERLVVCEDTCELVLPRADCVRLEARPASVDGVAGVDLATLVRTALRLRPDRLVVGEFRGTEVLAAVEALNTGHDGSLATCHANSAVDALRRVETLVMQAAPSWPLAAIRRQVSRSIDVVVHLARDASGRRRIVEIAEVVETDAEPAVRSVVDGSGLQRRRRA